MSHPLPAAAKALIDATNNGDTEKLLAIFSPDATLVDWGRTFRGRADIGQWNRRENIGTKNQIAVKSVTVDGDVTRVAISVTGEGFNGDGTFAFTIARNKITRLEVT